MNRWLVDGWWWETSTVDSQVLLVFIGHVQSSSITTNVFRDLVHLSILQRSLYSYYIIILYPFNLLRLDFSWNSPSIIKIMATQKGMKSHIIMRKLQKHNIYMKDRSYGRSFESTKCVCVRERERERVRDRRLSWPYHNKISCYWRK